MRRLGLAAIVMLAAAPVAQAKRCSQYHQRDLAPAYHVRLVEPANGDGGSDLVGCILPRGKPRLIAYSADYEVETYDYALRQVAREWVLVDTSGGSQYGGGTATYVFDIRSGRSYSVISSCYEILTGFCAGPPQQQQPRLTVARINDIGQSVVLLIGTDTQTLRGYASNGFSYDIDSGAPGEITKVRLNHSVVSWLHAGERRTFALDG
jgi:hypothetical protein